MNNNPQNSLKDKQVLAENLYRQSKIFLFLFLLLITSCNRETNVKTIDTQTKWGTGSPVLYEDRIDRDFCYFRPVLIGEEYFGFRAYDYKGGYYICTQIAVASKKENERQVKFDQIKEQYLYLVHCIPMDGIKYKLWEVPQYQIYYLKLPSMESLDSINYETIAQRPEWRTYYETVIGNMKGRMPDWLLLRNRLGDKAEELKQAKIEEWIDELYGTRENFYDTIKSVFGTRENIFGAIEESKLDIYWAKYLKTHQRESKFDDAFEKDVHSDMIRLVRKLKAQGQYDTIVKTNNSMLYVNTECFSYEIADDPEVFYVIKREYYPNGTLKSRGCFLSGITNSESLLFGPYEYYDKNGKLTYFEQINQIFFAFDMEYYLGWLEARNYINTKTGKGKPTMSINTHINPREPSHGETRVRIETNWQIQVDEEEDTVAILIKEEDDKETVFIFSNSSKIIWDKFNR